MKPYVPLIRIHSLLSQPAPAAEGLGDPVTVTIERQEGSFGFAFDSYSTGDPPPTHTHTHSPFPFPPPSPSLRLTGGDVSFVAGTYLLRTLEDGPAAVAGLAPSMK